MQLTPEQISFYHENGYLLLPECFTPEEVALMKSQLPIIFAEDTPARVLEEGTDVVRMMHGSHKTNPVFEQLVRDARILRPTQQLLEDDIYVHQFKINAKAAMAGEVWAWHQDFVFWHKEDGMPTPRTLNAGVFLDEVTEFNGPLVIIPKTQGIGMRDDDAQDVELNEDDPSWQSHLTAKLKYELTKETLADYATEFGMVAPKGVAGSVLLFAPSVFHGSAPNISPFDRNLALVSYNSVENQLHDVPEPRPWFLAERDFTPLEPIEAPLTDALK